MAKTVEIYKLLTAHGLFETPEQITPYALAGQLICDGTVIKSPHERVAPPCAVRIRDYYKKYVSRGGVKLEYALKTFGVDPAGRTALDCGASTGGFTDCLLRHGAQCIYAVEAGRGQLDSRLANDPRVADLHSTNLSDISAEKLHPPISLATLDIGYLSLTDALPIAQRLFIVDDYDIVALLKPIYETANMEKRRTGAALDEAETRAVIRTVCECIECLGLVTAGFTHSPIRGGNGLIEYFVHIKPSGACGNLAAQIDMAIAAGAETPERLDLDYTGVLSWLFM